MVVLYGTLRLIALAEGAIGRGSGIEGYASQRTATLDARFASSAVHVEVMLVRTLLAIDVGVVAQGRPAVVDSGLQDRLDGLCQIMTALFADAPRLGVDSRDEQRFVGINVSNASDRSLAQELGLDRS